MFVLLLTPLAGVFNPVKAANELGKDAMKFFNEMYELEAEENEDVKLSNDKKQAKTELENYSQDRKANQERREYETSDKEKVLYSKPEKYHFILDDADGEYRLPVDIEEKIFFWETQEEDLGKAIEDFFVRLFEMKKENVSVSHLMSKDGKTVWDYQDAEKEFDSRISETKDISIYGEWIKDAPHSSEFDEIIAGREVLGTVRVGEWQGNSEIWWKLANDYQRYATEFEEQTENEEAILYYYSMSIYSCIEALEYDMDSEKKYMIINYMRGRYEDLCYYKSTVPIKYKKRAEQISECLREMELY